MNFVTYNEQGEECQRFYLQKSFVVKPMHVRDKKITGSYSFKNDLIVIQHPEGSFTWIIPKEKRSSFQGPSQITIPHLSVHILNASYIWQLGGFNAQSRNLDLPLRPFDLFPSKFLDLRFKKQ